MTLGAMDGRKMWGLVRYGRGDRDHRDIEKIRDDEGGVQRRGQCECNGAGLPSQPVGNLEHQKSHV